MSETRMDVVASPFAIDQHRARRNRRRAGALVGGMAAAPAVLVFVLAAVLLTPIVAAVPAVVVGLLVALWLWRAGPGFTVRRLGALPADPVNHARLHNLVEGLCPRVGIPKPTLLLLADPAPNTLSVGLSPRSASLVVTTGLLEKLTRIELEGVIAHELVHIRAEDSVVSAAAALVVAPLAPIAPALAVRVVEGLVADREGRADLGAIGLTRYPPGLVGALEKVRNDPTSAEPRRPGIDQLWNFPPHARAGAGQGPAPSVLDLRIEALLEL